MRISTFNEIKCYSHTMVNYKKAINDSFGPEYSQQITSFFRYGNIDKQIFDYLRKKHTPETSLKILSIGCSLGADAYSYAIVLNDLNPKPRINAFDISPTLVSLAKTGKYCLSNEEKLLLAPSVKDLHCESEPSDEIIKIRNAFNENFEKVDNNNTYKKRINGLQNCNFYVGDALNINKTHKEEYYDLILCRYILHYFNDKDIESVFKQIYQLLKPDGILCIEPSKCSKYEKLLTNADFKPAFSLNKGIFQKI